MKFENPNLGKPKSSVDSEYDIQEQAEYQKIKDSRISFLENQKGISNSESKSFQNLEKFKQDPQGSLRELFKNARNTEIELLNNETKRLKEANLFTSEDLEMHLRNLVMFNKKLALIEKYGADASQEVLEESQISVESPDSPESYSTAQESTETVTDKILNKSLKRWIHDKWQTMSQWGKKQVGFARAGLLSLALLGSPQGFANNSTNPDVNSKKMEVSSADSLGLDSRTVSYLDARDATIENTNVSEDSNVHIDIHNRFTKKDTKTGEVDFNPWSLVSPLGIEVGTEKEIVSSDKITIPFEYSRLLNSADLTNPEDVSKVENYIRTELQKTFANNLSLWLGSSEALYHTVRDRDGEKNLIKEPFNANEITSIKITGYASPELARYGASSVIPGSIEQENLDLAQLRAEKISSIVTKILQEDYNIEQALEIDFEEIQFSQQEWKVLLNIADKNGIEGATSEERIFKLCADYNNNVLNQETEEGKMVGAILNSKRVVEIEIETKGKQENKTVIPIPLTLLLLRCIGDCRRRKKTSLDKTKNPPSPENEVKPEYSEDQTQEKSENNVKKFSEIFSEQEFDKEKIMNLDKDFYQIYQECEEGVDYRDLRNIDDMFIQQELYEKMGDENFMQRGLDYYGLIEYFANSQEYANTTYSQVEELERDLAKSLLKMWQEYDRSVRLECGIQTPQNAMEYRHDTHKVLWAKRAAPIMRTLIETYKENPGKIRESITQWVKDKQSEEENLREDVLNRQQRNEDFTLEKDLRSELAQIDNLMRAKEAQLSKDRKPEDDEWFELENKRKELIARIEAKSQ